MFGCSVHSPFLTLSTAKRSDRRSDLVTKYVWLQYFVFDLDALLWLRSGEIVRRRWVMCTSSAVSGWQGCGVKLLLTVCQVARFCRASWPRGRQLNRCIPGNQVALYAISMAICHTEARVHAYAAARQTWRAAWQLLAGLFLGT